MGIRDLIPAWSVVRQLGSKDRFALGEAARSSRQANLIPRTAEADEVVRSICPYCAVGCGQRIFVKDGEITQIEGDPDSPISRGRLCPKGAASRNFVQSPVREYRVKYRRPYSTEWEDLDIDTAVDMIADRLIETRAETWEDTMETPPHFGLRPSRRRHAGQRGELPDKEVLHRDGRGSGREPGKDMTLLHGARSGHLVR
jgi:formate dehydrogenase major subunit